MRNERLINKLLAYPLDIDVMMEGAEEEEDNQEIDAVVEFNGYLVLKRE
jgi:hypothetical protein